MALIDTYKRNVEKTREVLAKLATDKSKESDKIAKANDKINRARATINRTKSQATISSKLKEISRVEKEINTCNSKIADIEKKRAKAEKDLSSAEKRVRDEEDKILKQRIKQEEKAQKETKKQIDLLNQAVENQAEMQNSMKNQLECLQYVPDKITVLFLAANPNGTDHLRLDAEAREIQEMIRKSEYRDTINFVSRWAVRTSDILQVINETDPDVIHFSGHGAQDGSLAFEDIKGNCKLVSKEAMAQTVSTLSDKVKLMFFNACFSAIQAENIVQYVDAAIGMNTSIGDEAALVFASQFYSSIGFGKSLNTAFAQAKAALMLEGIQEENTPELYVKESLDPDEIYLVKPNLE